MKTIFIPILTVLLATTSLSAQDLTINLKGDANTEQSAKLELIRILQERLNKLTVAQLNSRILVSKGVKGYYKVDEIMQMHKKMWGLRVQLTDEAEALKKGNAGFGDAGNNFIWSYIMQWNDSMGTAGAIKTQTEVLITDGKPIALPPMPTFNITPASSDPGADLASAMSGILNDYGVHSQSDLDRLPQATQDEIKQKMNDAAKPLMDNIKESVKNSNKQVLATLGNIVGTAFGVPGAGSMLVGLASGNTSALSGLVGSIVDNFALPDTYFDSPTLKLTDAERLKMIDELHLRMSECFQKGMALRASMNSEVKKRYNVISQPRNEQILYGPKK